MRISFSPLLSPCFLSPHLAMTTSSSSSIPVLTEPWENFSSSGSNLSVSVPMTGSSFPYALNSIIPSSPNFSSFLTLYAVADLVLLMVLATTHFVH